VNENQAIEIHATHSLKIELGDKRPEVSLDMGHAIGYLEAIGKADKIFDLVAEGIFQDDHSMLKEALDKWEKEK